MNGINVDKRIEGTLGITAWSGQRVLIEDRVRHLDVDLSQPVAVAGHNGWTVRPLKRYMSWVYPVVRQGCSYLQDVLR